MVEGAGRMAKRMVMQCINGVGSNPVEGRTKIWQLYNLILTLFGLIFRRIYIYILKRAIKYKNYKPRGVIGLIITGNMKVLTWGVIRRIINLFSIILMF